MYGILRLSSKRSRNEINIMKYLKKILRTEHLSVCFKRSKETSFIVWSFQMKMSSVWWGMYGFYKCKINHDKLLFCKTILPRDTYNLQSKRALKKRYSTAWQL